MTGSCDDLIEYRLERAQEALEEARLMADWGHPNTAVSRLYYACFYAVSALLLAKGLSAVKHSGIRSLFGQHYVKTGLISKELAAFYNDLFESRQESDYEDFFRVDPGLIETQIDQAQQFIAAIVRLLEAASGP